MKEVNFEYNKEQMLKEMIFTSNVSDFDKKSSRMSGNHLNLLGNKGRTGRGSSLSQSGFV